MTAVVLWYLVVQLVGLAALPLTWRLCAGLPDRGYSITKTLGILLVGVTLWLGTAYGMLRNELGGAVLAVMIVAGASGVLGWPGLHRAAGGDRPLVAWMRRRLAAIAFVEALFAAGFAGWAIVRAYDPAVDHTEQPMDLLFMSAIWTSPTFPPRDPWLAGHAISYYYGGYWLLMTVARLAGQPPEIAYNVGQACWFGLLLAGCGGIGANLAALDPRRRSGTAACAGLLSALAVAFIGNPRGLLDATRSLVGASSPGLWWFPSSRALRDADLLGRPIELIDEFPAFSYVLGDDHPHVLAMPFLLLVIALAMAIFLAPPAAPGGAEGRAFRARGMKLVGGLPLGAVGLALLVICFGGLLFIDPSDLVGGGLVLVVARALSASAPGRPGLRAVTFALVLVVGAIAVYAPYAFSAQSQVAGVVPNLFHPTPISQLLAMFGILAPGVVALIWRGWRERRPSPASVARALAMTLGGPALVLLMGLVWATTTPQGQTWLARHPLPPDAVSALPFIFERWRTGWPTLLALGVLLGAVATALGGERAQRRIEDPALRTGLLLAGVGLVLVMIPEMIYLADSFGTRMNTVFKLYYQAWLFLGLAAAYGTIASLRDRNALATLAGCSLIFLVVGAVYPIAAIRSMTDGLRHLPSGLDALRHLSVSDPDELAAIRWVRLNTRDDARVVQGIGASYRPPQGRLSVATGRATLVGWEGHELQWRGAGFSAQMAGRREALDEIYGGGSADRLRALLEMWSIDYVYVSPRERARYGGVDAGDDRFRAVMELAFERGEVRLYRRRG